MKKKTICLFTAHTPSSGGGGAILRSLTANLPNINIKWYYTAGKAAPGYEAGYLGQGIMGGPFLQDIKQTWKMLNNKKVAAVDDLVNKLLQIECDAYWIVSHNEGLRLAYDLATTQQARAVHMTVHDDWAGALSARSLRYRFMSGAALRLTVKALHAVATFDVVSFGMRQYYQQLSGRTGDVCHRYLPASTISTPNDEVRSNASEVMIGHIGSIYKKEDLLAFISLAKDFFEPKGQKPVLQLWGCHLNTDDIPARFKANVIFHPTLPEEEVVPLLNKCSFVYAMYPMGASLQVFSQTSLPTKLTSYLLAGCPVFGHCSADSSLAEYLNASGLGVQWNNNSKQAGQVALLQITHLTISDLQLQAARERYFGETNLKVMNYIFGVEQTV